MQRLWPLTGRGEELAAVHAAMHRTDGAHGIVISGAQGVGKTRLAREALAVADGEGSLTHWIIATTSGRELPLGACAALLGNLEGDPFRVFRHAAEVLAEPRGHSGVVIGVDDAHLVDNLTAVLLLQLVWQCRVTVILTVRSGEPTPDALRAIWKDGHLDRLEIQHLSGGETRRLLEGALGGALDVRSAEALFALTGGNPLYLHAVVQGELRSGRLAATDGTWRWDGGFEASPELIEVVGRSMSDVPESAREVLDLLAVGGALDVDCLETVVDKGQIEAAEASGAVVVTQSVDGLCAQLGHPLYGEVRRAQIGHLRARRLRGTAVKAMSQRSSDGAGELLRRAVLCLDSDLPADPGLFAEAANHALHLFDYALGERLARAAVDAGGGFEALLLLGYAQGFGNKAVEATATLREARTQAQTNLELVRTTVASAGHVFFMLGRPDEALAMVRDAEDALHDTANFGMLAPLKAVIAASLGRPRHAVELANLALQAAELPPQAIVLSMWGLVGGLGMLGRANELAEHGDRAWTVGATTYDSSQLRLGTAYFELTGLRLAGYVNEAERLANSRRSQIDAGLRLPAAMAQVLVAEAELAHGFVTTGIGRLKQALAVLAEEDTGGWAFHASNALTTAYALVGDPASARDVADQPAAVRHPGHLWVEPDLLLSRAWVAAAEGASSEAVAITHESAAWAAAHDHLAHQMFALATAVRFGDRTVAQALGDLASRVQGPRAPAAARQAAALASDDGDGLLHASRAFEQMGDLLSSADAAAQAASAYQRRGLHGSRLSAAARAARLQSACQGAQTPALRAAVSPLPLTDREREIVTLAARGLSNREIADRLVVSVRTVEGHLYRASAKLGTSNRDDFADLLEGS